MISKIWNDDMSRMTKDKKWNT